MIRRSIGSIVFLSLLLSGCGRKDSGSSPITEQHLPDDASVVFDLEPVPSKDDAQVWIGSYSSQGKTARFRFEFGPLKDSPGAVAKGLDIKFGEGTFSPQAGSDSSVLLAVLRKALQAKAEVQPAQTKDTVPFSFAKLGDYQSQIPGGGFAATPAGDWTTMKLTLGDGAQECEVFLNLNATSKKGQFAMKDPGYGDRVLKELAKVL